ncbi:MAG: hypothetical protein ACI92W_002619 [Paraglaciecola sp.]|jgi:sialate O-acetylesterase
MIKTTLIILFLLPLSLQAGDYGNWLELNLKGYWKFIIGDNKEYAEPGYDDSQWDEVFVPSAWENEGYHGYDGFAWYRVGFELTSNTIDSKSLFLDLGYIDDADEVFINGVRIGFTGNMPPDFSTAYNSRRTYHLPNNILKKDAPNIIAVRVYDTVLDGGIISGTIGIFSANDKLPAIQHLEGIWKIQSNRNSQWRSPDYDDSNWQEAMVPGFWHEMKNQKPSGSIATYRKTFELSEFVREEDGLVVVLGRIDDFDQVYLNGILIGQTKDYRPLGWSESWSQVRIYDIPDDIINRYGDNILTVEVEDIGGNAGIYEGPILITNSKTYRRIIRQFGIDW